MCMVQNVFEQNVFVCTESTVCMSFLLPQFKAGHPGPALYLFYYCLYGTVLCFFVSLGGGFRLFLFFLAFF